MDYGDPRIPDSVWLRCFPEPNTGCWLWAGPVDQHGYGRSVVSGIRGNHRFACVLQHGARPKGRLACHTCDVPSCMNPDHLYWGTPQQNQQDAVVRGRNACTKRTHCPNGHPYEGDNTLYVKHPSGTLRRRCRACQKEYMRVYWLSNKAEH